MNQLVKIGENAIEIVTTLPEKVGLGRGSYVDIVGVTGSIPVTPTIKLLKSLYFLACYILPGRFIRTSLAIPHLNATA